MYLTGSAGVRTRNHFTLILTRDGGGTIDAQEIHEMVMGLFAMSGMEVTTDTDDSDKNDNDDDYVKVTAEEADACTLEILEAIDVDKDGDVTMVRGRYFPIYYDGAGVLFLFQEEFIEHARKSSFIDNLLQN